MARPSRVSPGSGIHLTTPDDSIRHDAPRVSGAPPVIDARGLLCPLPLVKAARAFQGKTPGFVIELWSDDPSAATDVPEWCAERGHRVLSFDEAEGVLRFRLERGGD